MDSAPSISPSSDERFWSKLGDRVDSMLEERKPKQGIKFSSIACGVESERGRRLREDSLLLIRGLDSIDSSVSQLSKTWSVAQQGVGDLARTPPTKVLQRESHRVEEEEPKAKRHCGSIELPNKNELIGSDTHEAISSDESSDKIAVEGSDELPDKGDKQASSNVMKSKKLEKAKDLAMSLTTKAATVAKELKTIKSVLSFMQERCSIPEEENRRLREGFEKGVGPEEDDLLVRLQLEALLAKKSRLANENANPMRENQCLHQLVEYHQLTSQDLSASYEQVIHGMCLDFSSPLEKMQSELGDDNDYGGNEAPCIPTDKLGFFSSTDENHKNLQE